MQEKLQNIINRIRNFSRLEIVGIFAIGILIINSLFSFTLTVSRKPILNRLLGQKTGKLAAVSSPQADSAAPLPLVQIDTEAVLPTAGVVLPVEWKSLGKQLVAAGVIDKTKFEALYSQRGGMSEHMKKMLGETGSQKIAINPENSGELLNLLWALGLGNKNEILDKGEMWDKQFGGDAAKFASTGGWTLATGPSTSLGTGNIMDHYSKHSFIKLTKDQQAMVDKVSRGIFRPCCGNSTHFPDCNHGMAMLGLLQLMASQGVSEADMYKNALAVNAYWFPDTYLTIASYLKTKGKDYAQANPQELLSAQYSSAQGYRQILNQVQPVQGKQSGGCGV